MPPLIGFSENQFKSRDDVLRAAASLIKALMPYKSSSGARVKLSTATGAGFDEIAAQLEGFARPLWVVADLLALESTESAEFSKIADLDLDSWVRGLEAGVDPESDSFWGHLGNHDQRMVEMEPIAYGILSAPSVFFPPGPDSKVDQERMKKITSWLYSINTKEVPPSNWRWFRVLVNLALVKSCGISYHEVKPFMDADLKLLDSFYLADGWSSDGLWSEDKKQADYYSGSFAIQFSQLAYARFAGDLDPERVHRYRVEAGKFAETFWRYFDTNGAAIPFGRSLSYRFAFAAFWSAVAVTDVPLPPPLNHLGVIKGLLLRHLRWWASKKDIFNTDGTLTIGYTYPNMYMSEDYNSPQSLYWCLKSFSVLGLTGDHPFWTCEELPHPLAAISGPLSHGIDLRDGSEKLNDIGLVSPAVQIICSSLQHHFLLSCGQFTKKTHKAREAKYSKFAYSSAFAFSVPTGPLLEQMAPDSTLCISNDGGETWKVRWEPIAARITEVRLSIRGNGETEATEMTSSALVSAWRPWKMSDIQIETILIPPLKRWPGWHVRVHKINWQTQQSNQRLTLVDAGFAIASQSFNDGLLPKFNSALSVQDQIENTRKSVHSSTEGVWEGDLDCLVVSGAGASGIAQISNNYQKGLFAYQKSMQYLSRGYVLKPNANTNLVAQRTIIPTLYHEFNSNSSQDTGEVWFVTGVFAVAAPAALELTSIKRMWQDKPSLEIIETDE